MSETCISKEQLFKMLDREINIRKNLISIEVSKAPIDDCYSMVIHLSNDIQCLEHLKRKFEHDFYVFECNMEED